MKKRIFSQIKKFINIGVIDNTNSEKKRELNLINVTGAILFLIGFIMAVLNYLSNDLNFTYMLIIFCFLISLSLFTQYLTKSSTQSSYIMSFTIMLLSIYLLYTGGVENHGHMWVLVLPPIIIFVFGLRLGLYLFLLILFSFVLMLFYPNNLLLGTVYSSRFKIRFLLAFVGSGLFSIASEYARVTLVDKINEKNLHLKKTLQEVKELSGLIPICANCKKIRDDNGYWNEVEIYIKERSKADFSHGICPTCVSELYPELKRNKK